MNPFSCRPLTVACVALGLALAGPTQAQAPQARPQTLPVTPLKIGTHVLQAEVADSEEERSHGLMFRTGMPEDHGMLFVFAEPGQYCFWMRNTLIPLAIAFIDDEGRIVDMAEMQARDDRTHHCPRKPVRMALEMNKGWFTTRGIAPGAEVQGLPSVARAGKR